jgi:hypothetical protein
VTEPLPVLTVLAGANRWAIPTRQIQRTLVIPVTTAAHISWLRLPTAQSQLPLHAVVDLASWWQPTASAPGTPPPHQEERVVVVPSHNIPLGLAVSRAQGLQYLAPEALRALPALLREPMQARGCSGLLPAQTTSEPIIWLLDLWALLRAAVEQWAAQEGLS